MEINRNGRFILSNENSLLIAQARKIDAGNYTCVAANIAGTYSSEPAELTIHGITARSFSRAQTDSDALVDNRGWADWQPFSECKGVPCSTGRQRRVRTCLNPPTVTNRPNCDGEQMQERECAVPCAQEPEYSDWSECTGVPCQIGKQRRLRACPAQSDCPREQVQERNCTVACAQGAYSNWTEWSACRPPECTSVRSRQCLREPCVDYLIESQPCRENLCSSKN